MYAHSYCFVLSCIGWVLTRVAPFYEHDLTSIPGWISDHMPSKVLDEMIYPFPNFNGTTVEVYEWISNFIRHFMMDVTTYPC